MGLGAAVVRFGMYKTTTTKSNLLSNVDLIIVDSKDFDLSSFSFSLLTFAFKSSLAFTFLEDIESFFNNNTYIF